MAGRWTNVANRRVVKTPPVEPMGAMAQNTPQVIRHGATVEDGEMRAAVTELTR